MTPIQLFLILLVPFVLFVVGMLLVGRRRWRAWDAALDTVAREHGLVHRRGEPRAFGAIYGTVEGQTDGVDIHVTNRTETLSSPNGGNRERLFWEIRAREDFFPSYLGAPRDEDERVVDYSKEKKRKKGRRDETIGPIDIGGAMVTAEGANAKLRATLEQDAELRQLVRRVVGAGGHVESGRVIVRRSASDMDPSEIEGTVEDCIALARRLAALS